MIRRAKDGTERDARSVGGCGGERGGEGAWGWVGRVKRTRRLSRLVSVENLVREGLDVVGELGEEPALEIHRDVALERDGDFRALDEGEAVRASPEEHLLDAVAMSARERGVGNGGERGQASGRGTRREAREAGVTEALRHLRETEGISRKSPKRRERNGRASARRARPTSDARRA